MNETLVEIKESLESAARILTGRRHYNEAEGCRLFARIIENGTETGLTLPKRYSQKSLDPSCIGHDLCDAEQTLKHLKGYSRKYEKEIDACKTAYHFCFSEEERHNMGLFFSFDHTENRHSKAKRSREAGIF